MVKLISKQNIKIDFNKIMNDIANSNPIYKHPIIGKAYFRRLTFALDKINLIDKKVLDIGFGNGIMLPYLIKYGASEIYGIEPYKKKFFDTKEILKINNLESVIHIFNEYGDKMHFSNKKFDIVFAMCVMEHIIHPNSLYTEVKRVLKDKGTFIVMVPTENKLYELSRFILRIKKPESHYYNSSQIKEMLSQHFKIEREYSYYRLFSFFKFFICKKK